EPAAPKPPRLIYRLVRKDKLIAVTRYVVHGDGREERFRDSLATDRARGASSGLNPTHDDMKVDRILGSPPRESILGARVADVLAALASAEGYFEGPRVTVSGERVLPRATVSDAPGGGFRLRLEKDPSITEIVARGLARCGDTLRPLGELSATGELLERLPLERTFAKADTAELVAKVLPELEAKLDVIIATSRLPRKAADARPRIAMDLSHQGHTLSVLPSLVYGDPPVARVDGDVIVSLGDTVPVRRHDAERELLRRLRDELHLVPGRRVDLDGSEAIRFATKLRDWQKRVGDDGHAGFENRPLRPRIALRAAEARRGRGGAPGLARRPRARAARRGRVGAAPGRLAGQARAPRRRSPRGARQRQEAHARGAAHGRGPLRRARRAAPAAARAARPAVRRLRRHSARALARRSARDAPRVPAPGRRL